MDCITTRLIAALFSHSAIARRSSVQDSEFPHRLRIPLRRHRHKMAGIADIDAGHIGMHDLQARLFGLKLPLQFLSFLAAATSPLLTVRRWTFFRLAMAYFLVV